MNDPIAVIVREPGGIPLDDWLTEISRNPALKAMDSKAGINPFTRRAMIYQRPYAAHFLDAGGIEVGSFIWQANRILIWGELDAVGPAALEISNRLHSLYLLADVFPEQLHDQ
jgi:hypothetical protein